jgi:hypothetical protein
MQLKETKSYNTSTELNVSPVSENSGSSEHRVYEILYPLDEEQPHPNIVSKETVSNKFNKPLFSNVSTLEWLTTWRSLEE